ncbi:hypothetical protein CR513_39791, partial [Mucuna pruriens]
MGQSPSLNVFFWFFGVQGLEKVGWLSLNSQPHHPVLKPFSESYKFFKDHFFQTKAPTVSIRVERSCLETWEEKFLIELLDRPMSSYNVLLKMGLDATTRKALRKQKQASSSIAPSSGPKAPTSHLGQDVTPPTFTQEANPTPVVVVEGEKMATSRAMDGASIGDRACACAICWESQNYWNRWHFKVLEAYSNYSMVLDRIAKSDFNEFNDQ